MVVPLLQKHSMVLSSYPLFGLGFPCDSSTERTIKGCLGHAGSARKEGEQEQGGHDLFQRSQSARYDDKTPK